MKFRKKKKKFKVDSIDMILCGVLIAVLSNTFILSSSRISGSSMEPNFHDGAYVSVYNQNFLSKFSRFDLVVVSVPNDVLSASGSNDISTIAKKKNSTFLFKRIIGLEGEKVEFKNNELFINGVKTVQNFLDSKDITYATANYSTANITYYDDNGVKKNLADGIIPKGYYFVMGDNRNNSKDSRIIGLVKKSQLVGEVKMVLYPWKYFGLNEINEAK